MKNRFQRILSILAVSLAVHAFGNTADQVNPLLIGAKTPSVLLANQKGEATDLRAVLVVTVAVPARRIGVNLTDNHLKNARLRHVAARGTRVESPTSPTVLT